jgi:hypothetical protein
MLTMESFSSEIAETERMDVTEEVRILENTIQERVRGTYINIKFNPPNPS